jgi:hypothetical protein
MVVFSNAMVFQKPQVTKAQQRFNTDEEKQE